MLEHIYLNAATKVLTQEVDGYFDILGNEREPRIGYLVESATKALPVRWSKEYPAILANQMAKYVMDNYAEFRQPDTFIGLLIGEEEVYVKAVKLYAAKSKALAAGVLNDASFIWDCENNRVIDVYKAYVALGDVV